MARLFDDASSQYASYAGAVISSYPVTVSFWAYPDAAVASDMFTITGLGSNNEALVRLTMGADQTLTAGVRAGGSQSSSVSTATLTLNAWNHAAGVFTDTTNRVGYVNGVASTADANLRSVGAVDTTSIGAYRGTATINPTSGAIAEVAVWSAALTAAEITSLNRGFSPLLVRPASLVAYWPLVGRTSPEVNLKSTSTMTLTNGPTAFSHPRMIYPRRRFAFGPAAAASTFQAAWAMRPTLIGGGVY